MNHTTGEIATTLPDTNTNQLIERSSSNWIERPKHKKQKAKFSIKAPDFKKLLSRDYLERLHEDKRTVIPFSLPNYKYTQPSNNYDNF